MLNMILYVSSCLGFVSVVVVDVDMWLITSFGLFPRIQRIWPRRRQFAARTWFPNAPQITVYGLKSKPRGRVHRGFTIGGACFIISLSSVFTATLCRSIEVHKRVTCSTLGTMYDRPCQLLPVTEAASEATMSASYFFIHMHFLLSFCFVGPRLTTPVAVVAGSPGANPKMPADGRARLIFY